MDVNEYQKSASSTATYLHRGDNLVYPVLGLAGESGEVADKVKKILRSKGTTKPSTLDNETKIELAKEVGDVLWYVALVAEELGFTLEEVAQMNINKLLSRKERGVIKGNGDNR